MMKQILIKYGIPEETVNAIMMLDQLYVHLTEIHLSSSVLQGDRLAPFIFIICLDHILKTSLDNDRELGFTLTERRSRGYPAEQITDIDYIDDIAIRNNTLKDANNAPLLKIELAPKEIGLNTNTDKIDYINLN